ncbi:YncE family protein [Geomicrobium sp. JCM 19038]|uniref:YncE family protein n=1 Tax=Geomicrobium sp. JCM 19038 TaxID=1460635 RepID=UPI00045F2F08|nr:YncE family protein [Geomicrobium sp. JCM 19038]GAK08384.1 collagen triple helix repeat domain protein [Geomicrobium sp. JCM 19038]
MDDCCKRIEINNNLINGPANVIPPTAPTAPTQPTIPPAPTAPTGLNKVYGLQSLPGNTAVFDGFTNEQIGTLPTFPLSFAFAIAVDPYRNYVYIAAANEPGTVYVYSAVDESLITQFGLSTPGPNPEAIEINFTTNKLYVATLTGRLFVVDGETFTVEAVIGEGVFPSALNALAVNSLTNLIYIVSGGLLANEMNVVNGATNEIIGPFTEGLVDPSDVIVDERTNLVYVTNNGGGTVTVYDGSTLALVNTIVVNGSPNRVEIDPLFNELYVTNGDGYVTVIDETTSAIIAEIPVADPGANPVTIGLNPYTRRAYVGFSNRQLISIIDMDTKTEIGSLPKQSSAFRVVTLP